MIDKREERSRKVCIDEREGVCSSAGEEGWLGVCKLRDTGVTGA